MNTIGILGAFLGGLLALLSPCSALLLPSFFAYAFDGLGTLITRTAIFYLGLATVLIPLGAGVGALGSALTTYRTQTTIISATVIIIFGAMILLGRGFHLGTAQRIAATTPLTTTVSVFILGTVYGLAGFCSGPLLGAVLTVAVAGGHAPYGALLMAIYAAGMTTPLLVLAALWDKYDISHRHWLRGTTIHLGPLRTHTTALISGLLFIGIGVLFLLTAGTANLGSLLSADTAVALQGWIAQHTTTNTNLVVALVITLIIIGILTRRLRRTLPQPEPQPTTDAHH